MKPGYILLVLLLLALGCAEEQTKKPSETPDSQAVQSNEKSVSVKEEKAPDHLDRLNQILFDRLVQSNNEFYPTKDEQGIAQLDLMAYSEFLEGLEIFTGKFIASEIDRCRPCQQAIEAVHYSGEMELGWLPAECTFLEYLFWTGGHDKPDKFIIYDLKEEAEKTSAKMRYYLEVEGDRYYWDENQYLMIDYIHSDGQWLIDRVQKKNM